MAVRLVDPSVLVDGAPVDLFEVVGINASNGP